MKTIRLVLALALLCPAAGALAQDYRVDFLVNYGTRYWTPTGINNHGQVTGTMGDTHSPNAVTWDALNPTRAPTYLPFHSQCCTYAESWGNAINDRGQVVGSDTYGAALWNGATRPTLLDGETPGSSAADLNESGVVVGQRYFSGSDVVHATLWDSAGAHDLGSLGTESYAYAINESGVVAGVSLVPGSTAAPHATVWHGGTLTDLGAGWAFSLNDLGQVVGWVGDRAAL